MVEIVEESLDKLERYEQIPMRFEVRTVYEIEGDDPKTAVFTERPVSQPWIKDYDKIEGERPTSWTERWDVSNWGMMTAQVDGRWIGGCVLVHRTPHVNLLEGRDDLVIMWDLRVRPEWRGQGVGHGLFETAVAWARDREASELKIETQNINAPACRFYQRQGCHLGAINRTAYDDFPEEIQLFWHLILN